jgi:hypothetical protein
MRRTARAIGALALPAALALAAAAAVAHDLDAGTWYLVRPDAFNFTNADETGFWTTRGEHIRVDGRRDLALRLPPELTEGVALTVRGPGGFVVAARLIDGSKYGLFLAAYNRQGESTWTRKLGGDDATLRGPDGLFVGADGDILLAGNLSGCVRFAPKAKLICSDDKALAKYFDCEGDCEGGQPFVATFDTHGALKSVFSPAGYPATHFAGAQGRIAWAGEFKGRLDLDPDPRTTRMAAAPSAKKPGAGAMQAFWSFFDPRADMRYLDGRAIVGPANAAIRGATFDAGGTLLLLAQVDRGRRRDDADLLTDSTTATPLADPGASRVLVIATEPSGAPPTIRPLTEDRAPETTQLRLLRAPTGGVFVSYGGLTQSNRAGVPYRTIVAVHGPAQGWQIRVPNDVNPEAMLVDHGRICAAFLLLGPHQLSVGGRTVGVGEPERATPAIGCYNFPPKPPAAPRAQPAPPVSN